MDWPFFFKIHSLLQHFETRSCPALLHFKIFFMSYCFTLSPRPDRVMKLFISLDASSLELLSFFLTEFVSVTLFKTLSFSVLLFVVLFESFPINMFFFSILV